MNVGWKINLQADILTDAYSRMGDHQVQSNFVTDESVLCDRKDKYNNSGLSADRSQVDQSQRPKGQKFSKWADSTTKGQQTCKEVINANLKYFPGAAYDRR